ncbi:hypothetical protein BK670_24945 [Pseudomonas fluorescens]|uniref:Uncharacterized protein n=1 Tax=Pseudomonas fluorescens TaxID=294 RepID=A0A423M4I1_PSEFL|nr:hypothetical protein BK670_24945 [Pseudomonas fluorescens]
MSRVGLREDQREVEVLVTLIFAALPPEPRWCIREQARSHRIGGETEFSAIPKSTVGASLLAMRPEQTT